MHSPLITPRPFTAEEYHKMAEAGILGEDDRVELIEGEIVRMSPIGSEHADAVNRLTELLVRRVGDRVIVSIQNPVRLTTHSEPQPDVVLLKRRREYKKRLPSPEDVVLIVEVSDTTIETDRRVKIPLYARSKIPQAIILDLEGDAIENHTEPSGGQYRSVRRLSRGEKIRIVELDDAEFTVEELLGD